MTAAAACAHCGEPVPGALSQPIDKQEESSAPRFCCGGCEAVYQALHGEGLEAFYALRDGSGGEGRRVEVRATARDRFDDAAFLERHCEVIQGDEREIELLLDGVHCAGCVWIVEGLPHALSGVSEARLDLARGRLRLRWSQPERPLSQIVERLARFGYVASPLRAEGVRGRSEAERRLLVKVGVCWALAGNAMLISAALYAGLSVEEEPTMASAARWAGLGLSGLSVIVGGRVFLERAWASAVALWRSPATGWRSMSMDAPIALGITVGWAHSAWATATGQGEVWFDSVAVLIAALLTARWLQLRGRRAAGDAADRLLALIPTRARRIEEDGRRVEVEVEGLEPGQRVEVRAGEVFPVDGRVVSGASLVHRGVLTGESVPEPVVEGDAVEAGATNLGSSLDVEVEASGAQTRVGRLLSWVEAQAEGRAPTAQAADRLSGVFVVVVVIAAAATALAWSFVDPGQAVAHAVALLVISCPCALGMATPLALTVAVGHAARAGIFVKHDDVIEQLSKASIVVLDKTGTVTRGHMVLLELVGDDGAAALAARLESRSNHPIAHAMRRWADEDNGALEGLEDLEEVAGSGLRGRVDGRRVAVGRPDWVRAQAEGGAGWVEGALAATVGQWRTPALVAVDGRVEALLGFGDPIRPEARGLIEALKARGVEPVLLSGDHPAVVEAVARQLGIEAGRAHGGVSPEGKRAFVERLSRPAGGPEPVVVMVGDGINDAAALAAADVGVAVEGGAEASLVASDVFITRQGLGPILALLDGSAGAMSIIRRNFFISLLYNAAGVSLAALGLVSPLLAAVAMPISSLLVVASSLSQSAFEVDGARRELSPLTRMRNDCMREGVGRQFLRDQEGLS